MPTQDWTILVNGAAHTMKLTVQGDALLLPVACLPTALGWHVTDNALCREDRCLPLGGHSGVLVGDMVDLRTLAAMLHTPIAEEPAAHAIAFAESPEHQGALLRGGAAPDFSLPDLAGELHSLSQYRGRKILLVTWASWCGCREDLGAWQQQFAALRHHGLTVITVSQDARRDDAAPYIEAAAPEHPALLDPDHIVSHRYGLINVPTAIWIDEHGSIARPPRVEHATNTFAFAHGLDCEPHLAALRRWAENGQTDVSADETHRTTMAPSRDEQQARAHQMLSWHLYQAGATDAANTHWREAIRLSPYDWTIRRGSMWLRGENPFGSEFAEAWMEWDAAGRPDYVSMSAARAGDAGV